MNTVFAPGRTLCGHGGVPLLWVRGRPVAANHLVGQVLRWCLDVRNTCIFWVLLLGSAAAWAGDYIEEQAWFEDQTEQLTLAEVQRQEFLPFDGVLNRGFGSAPIWIRIKIRAASPEKLQQESNSDLVLRIMPAHLDEIELFDPLAETSMPRRTGDLHAWSHDEFQSQFFNFKLPPQESARYVWLRLKSANVRSVHMTILDNSKSRRLDIHLDMIAAVYLGCMVLFLGWALSMYMAAPEQLMTFFVAKQVSAVVYTLYALGYMRILLDGLVPPAWINMSSNVWVLVFTFASLMYQWIFLKELRPPAWSLNLFISFALAYPLGFLLLANGYVQQAMQLNLVVIFLGSLIGFLNILIVREPTIADRHGSWLISKKVLVGTHFLIFSSLVVSVVSGIGLLSNSVFTLYMPLLHGLFSGVVLMYILQTRARQLLHRQVHLQAEFETMRATAQSERIFREDQQHMLAMLAHELKTPLSVVRMLVGKKDLTKNSIEGVQIAIDDMNVIVDRCLQAGRLTEDQLVLQKTLFDPLALLQKIVAVQKAECHIFCEAADHFSMYSDEQIVRIVFGNLIENACRYRKPETGIVVRLDEQSRGGRSGILLVVENQPGGAGFPDPQLVFSKYYRAAKAHRQSGSGLGLYLVAGFAERLGGSVQYVPDPIFVKFELWLPL
ncbi:7TM-DISM domain-containing protein [Hydrogenophaga sp.]|uniref:sensor histidine kinase n=1 Tax=Hydrogenophaga sp. TaxID=1904254 RepID=UPI003F6BFDEA